MVLGEQREKRSTKSSLDRNVAQSILIERGACQFDDAYTFDEITAINSALDERFRAREDQSRSYVHIDEMLEVDVFNMLLNEQMKAMLLSIMPDPVLYHCSIIETAGNDAKPNLFGDTLAGWHRDSDCLYFPNEPTHVSIFVYLSNVGDNDGAFQIVPQDPRKWLRPSSPTISVQGPPGTTFAWQRSFFHRASPNVNPRRRRIFKISIQRNSFLSHHLSNANFRSAKATVPKGDPLLDMLLGRFQGSTAPMISAPKNPPAHEIKSTGTMSVREPTLSRSQIKLKLKYFRDGLRKSDKPLAAYD